MAHFKGGHEFQPGKKRRVSREAKARTDKTTSEQWAKLMEEHGIAYLRGDLATSSPQSYTIDEMREISAEMEASTAEVEAAIRADFADMSPELQSRMMELMKKADPDNFGWWEALLLKHEE